MNTDKAHQDKALDTLLAAAFRTGRSEDVDFEAVLAAFTPAERAKLGNIATYLGSSNVESARTQPEETE